MLRRTTLLGIFLLLLMPMAAFAQEEEIPQEIEWSTRANELEGETDTTITVSCPADGEAASLWGTEIFTDDSSVCTAAVHAGLITLEDGGEFVVTIRAGQTEYTASDENGISSSSWGSWTRSFSVSVPEIDAVEIGWATRADSLEGETDDTFTVSCPDDGTTGSLWGTEVYTADSSICTAAAHAGLITVVDGGAFVVTLLDGADEYTGTEQNGVTSSNWGSFSASFSVSALDGETDVEEDVEEEEEEEIEALEIGWATRADTLDGEIDDAIIVSCPEDGTTGSLWGTEVYTADSSICTAAVHAGLITVVDGGEFVVTLLDGADEYTGTEQNGVTSSNWGSFSASFSVSELDIDADVLEIEWTTRADTIDGETDDTFTVACPEDGTTGSLWGTKIYTADSSICTAAVHAGLITMEDGGEFVVTLLDGIDAYTGSEQNGVTSSDWGSFSASFSVSEAE